MSRYVVTVTPAETIEAERAYEEAKRLEGCGYDYGLTPQQKAGQASGRSRRTEAARRRYKEARAKVSRQTVDAPTGYALGHAAELALGEHYERSGYPTQNGSASLRAAGRIRKPGDYPLPDGSTISVERVEDDGEGR